MPDTITARIPFTGFYHSNHDAVLDMYLESMFCEREATMEIASDEIRWKAAHTAYARMYCDLLADECAATWEFVALESPREYNFRTDEIDVSITMSELQRMRRYILDNCESAWLELCKERLTARDGFIPFYSSNPYTWGTLETWETPQLSLLIECYCAAHCDWFARLKTNRVICFRLRDITQAAQRGV